MRVPLLRDYDCSAHVCAVRSDNGTSKKLGELVQQYKPNCSIEFVSKNIEDEQHHVKVDQAVATTILGMIAKVIGKQP